MSKRLTSGMVNPLATVTCLTCSGLNLGRYIVRGHLYNDDGSRNLEWEQKQKDFCETHLGHYILLEVDN